MREFTFRAVCVGVLLGLVFGAANAYLGLRVGLTVSASIPAAVLAVALFRVSGSKPSLLEANMAQTVGSASTSLASGAIFTVPALYLWGAAPPYWQVVALCFLGGVLGIAAMIPLRRLLIVGEHENLPFPEGRACAEVLRASVDGASGGTWIFRGMAVGAGVKLALGALFLMPHKLSWGLDAFLPKAELSLELAPALMAIGYILGVRQSGVLVAGALISALALTPLIAFVGQGLTTPLYPETTRLIRDLSSGDIWSKYVRYIGAGAVAAAGIATVARNLPSMVGALTAVLRGIRGGGSKGTGERTDRDLPAIFVIGGVALVVLVAGFVPGIFGQQMPLAQRLVCALGVGVFGVLFVTVAARIVGIVGVSSQPTSGITLITLLGIASVFAWQGWTDVGARAAVLTVGTIVAVAASKAGDISQDLKTGFLVGATPARQQLGQLIGAACACWAVAGTIVLLGANYEFGGKELSAPQATLMKTIIEGVLQGELPWSLVLSGAGISIGAMLCGISGLAFAIGVYLPLSSMAPIFVGGLVRGLVERRRGGKRLESDPGVLAASGVVAGEGLAGVLIAGLVGAGVLAKEGKHLAAGSAGVLLALATTLLLCAFFYRAGRSQAEP